MKDKKMMVQSNNTPDERHQKTAAMLAMIDYLVIEMGKISPITAYILDMASKNLIQEEETNPLRNGKAPIRQ